MSKKFLPSVIFGLFPIHYLEHSNKVFEWIILFVSGTWMLITALKIFVRVFFFFFFSTSFRHQHVSAKQKLDVKSLAEKYQALRDLKKGPQTKTFVKKYDLPCCEDKFYCNYKRITNLCFFNEVGNDMLELLQRFESLLVHDALENNPAFWIILTEKKILITVKISLYFISPIAFKIYQSQYRSKYNIRFTQRFIECKNFELSDISNIHYLEHFCWSHGSSR